MDGPWQQAFDFWNCATFRYGEARHPGPEQRIVSVNPGGWSNLAPLLSKMPEEVIMAQETFVVAGSVAKASFEAKACARTDVGCDETSFCF
eukprot:1248578-Amphidinium_carterae.1